MSLFVFFFFSSRRRHTRCSRDWSSDVCSSDLGEVFNHASMVFSAPTPVSVEQPWTAEGVASRLRKALYSEGEGAAGFGSYRVRGDRLEIRPGPASFFAGGPIREGPAVLEFHEGNLASISSLEGGSLES